MQNRRDRLQKAQYSQCVRLKEVEATNVSHRVITAPAEVSQILRDGRFSAVQYAARYAELADRLGLDFSTILFTLAHIPLWQAGEAHRTTRQRMAALIGARTPAVRAALADIVERNLGQLQQPGHHDVLRAVLVPLVDDVLSVLMEIDLDLDADSTISRIFSQTIGIAKRKRLEADLRLIRAKIEARFADLDDDDIGARMAMAILGRDPMIGTFGCSLHARWQGDAAPPADPAGDVPCRTGVPFVDRHADAAVCLGGASVHPGDLFRLWLTAFEPCDDPRERALLFGAGAHTCLGKPLGLELWRAMTGYLQANRRDIRVTRFALRRDDIFHYPGAFEVEVH
ncbi:MAG: hypothetical protein ACFB3T_08955 [Geminicoccaceae bacterium]